MQNAKCKIQNCALHLFFLYVYTAINIKLTIQNQIIFYKALLPLPVTGFILYIFKDAGFVLRFKCFHTKKEVAAATSMFFVLIKELHLF